MNALESAIRKAIWKRLRPWFVKNARPFPWRVRRTPYKVWLSEMMLQQTRAEQALPYYQAFLKRFPNLRALAGASEQQVLKQWEGLGYYARARHLLAAARRLATIHKGRFPRSLDGLLALPGIGSYTAAAVGSLALGLDLAVVDGNVARVLSRLFMTQASRKELQKIADRLLIPGYAGLLNEAMMELGAVCCLPRKPACPACPLRPACRAFAAGRQGEFPRPVQRGKLPHKVVGAGVTIHPSGKILIAQRNSDSMLGGLWEFPGGTLEPGETLPRCIARELKEELGIGTKIGAHLVTVRHAYSHFTIELHAYWARITGGRLRAIHCADFAWVTLGQMEKYPFSKADLEIIKALKARRKTLAHWPESFAELFPTV